MKFQLLKKLDSKILHSFLESQNDANFYHIPEWHDVLKKTFKCKIIYACVFEEEELKAIAIFAEIKGFLKGKRLISLPISHFVPILASHNIAKKLLLENIETLKEKYKYLEIKAEESSMCLVRNNLMHTIAMQNFASYEDYILKLNQNARRKIKVATKELTINCREDLKSAKECFKLMEYNKKTLGTLMYPNNFFKNLFNIIPKEFIKLHAVYRENTLLACGIVFKYNKRDIYFTAGSFKRPQYSQYFPNYGLLSSMIRGAFEGGAKSFDFGSTPIFHATLRQFKKSFNVEESHLNYSVISNNKVASINREGKAIKFISSMLKKAPVSINKLASKVLFNEVL